MCICTEIREPTPVPSPADRTHRPEPAASSRVRPRPSWSRRPSSPSPRPSSSAGWAPRRWRALRWFFRSMMLMTMMAAGGMGGGVAAAMARAHGRRPDRRCACPCATCPGAGPSGFALLFTLLAWTLSPALYRLLGGSGGRWPRPDLLATCCSPARPRDLGELLPLGAAARRRRRGDTRPLHAVRLSCSRCRCPKCFTLGIGDWPGLGMAGPAASSP